RLGLRVRPWVRVGSGRRRAGGGGAVRRVRGPGGRAAGLPRGRVAAEGHDPAHIYLPRRVIPAFWKPDFLAVKRTRPRLVGRSVKRTEPKVFVERGLASTPAPVALTLTPLIQ